MKLSVGVTIAGVILLAAIAGGSLELVRWVQSTNRRPPRAEWAPVLPVVQTTAWGELHPSFELHPSPRDGTVDTAWLSRAIADLPNEIVDKGATLHFLITQPEWAVFDERGNTHPGADEVMLTASAPDLGIGLELGRIVVNLHEQAGDRRWHTFEVRVPPCTRRLRLEAWLGEEPESNNAFDNVWISMQEPLVFRNDVTQKRTSRYPCPKAVLGNCGGAPVDSSLTRHCGDSRNPRTPSDRAMGALHTGRE